MSVLQSSSSPGQARRLALLQERASQMRAQPTPSERLMWSSLRGTRLGVAFRRQVVISPFIVDFLAPSRALVVEIDGDSYHASRRQADAARERKLVWAGYTVLRLPASLVERQLDEAVVQVLAALARC